MYAALLALLSLIPAPPPPFPPRHEEPPAKTEADDGGTELLLTADSVVELDGRPCKFADVPAGAKVVELAVAADKKTILKIGFASKK